MPSRNTNVPRVLMTGNPAVCMMGSFAPNGSSAIDATSRRGRGFTVAYTSTGLYTLTFTDKWTDLLSATFSLQLAAGDDKLLQVGTWTQASQTLTVRCWDISGAAVADIAANANNRINFVLWFANTSLGLYGS